MSEAYEAEFETEEAEQAPAFDLMAAIQSPNIAEDLDDSILAQIGAKVIEEFKIDEQSRKESGWEERYKDAMKLALQTKEAKNYPWPNASNVKYPLISTAAIQFNARAYPAIIDGPEIVKGAVKGRPTPEKVARADRVGAHMSYQLLEEMDDWEEDTDRLLMQLPIVGCAFRKTWFDPLKGYNCSHLVSALDFVVNYWTKDLETCPRATHVLTFYPYEVREKMLSGVWLEVDLGRPQSADNDDDAPFTFYEQARLWDLDEDGYPEPYTVTVEKESGKVVRIMARFDERGVTQREDGAIVRIVPTRVFTKYGFIPAPDGSFYDIGFGTLLNPLSETINSTINQLMDAGHLANVQGGFIGAGVSIKSGSQTFRPGEWRRATTEGGNLRENIVPLPTKEPSSVLFQLLGMLIEAARDVTATQDILGGDSGKGSLPVGTVSALIEQGLKTFTAIVKRLHRALKKELAILYALNGRYLEPEVYFTFQDEEGSVAQADYAAGDMDVVPVSDPNMATDMQRMQQAQFVMSIAEAMPGVIPPRKAAERALQAARVPDLDELLGPEQPPPPDPKMLEVEAKARLHERELDQKDGEIEIKQRVAASDIALKDAQTEQAKAELALMGPEFLASMTEIVRGAVQQALAMVENGGKPPVQPQELSGMEGEPGDGPVPPISGGPAPADDGGLGPGGLDVAEQPGEIAPDAGAFDPGMVDG
jgi:chaperonin GroES